MKKSIYDEAIELVNINILPRESGKTAKTKVINALQQAQAQAVIINKVKDTIEELKALVAKVPTTIELQTEVTEEVECPECGEEHEVEVSVDQEVPVPQLNSLWADLEKAISDLDYYLLAQELKSAKQ